MRDREVELSTVRIGDLGRPDSLTAVVVVLKVEDLAVARLSFSGGDRPQRRTIAAPIGEEPGDGDGAPDGENDRQNERTDDSEETRIVVCAGDSSFFLSIP